MRCALILATLLGAAACSGDPAGPAIVPAGGLDLTGTWTIADSTLYDITNVSGTADGLRHIGSYVVTGQAQLVAVDSSVYAAATTVTVTYTDSVPGSPARRTPQPLQVVNPIIFLRDSIFGVAAGGDAIPPEAQPTAHLIAWSYDQTSGQCQATYAGFHPATASCRQVVRWTR